MKYDLSILNEYVAKGLVEYQSHPTLPLTIWNYTRDCAWNRNWDEITIACRGLILDNEGTVIAKPFSKFFNIEEHKAEEIPNEPFDIFDKMDGSLGIIFHYERKLSWEERRNLFLINAKNKLGDGWSLQFDHGDMDKENIPTTIGEWHIATRGSFTSDQAIRGKKMLQYANTKYGLIPGWTYCVEIIYPENRIVVDYGNREQLVVLGVINNETGKEGRIENMVSEGWTIVKKYDIKANFAELKQMVADNSEGFVIRFKNGLRMKIKGLEYIRLHSLMTQFSNVDIWKCLKEGTPIDLENVPDEFDEWVRGTIKEMQDKYDARFKELDAEFWKTINRKEYYYSVEGKKDAHFMLKRLGSYSTEYQRMIWDEIRPVYSKPFWKKDLDI